MNLSIILFLIGAVLMEEVAPYALRGFHGARSRPHFAGRNAGFLFSNHFNGNGNEPNSLRGSLGGLRFEISPKKIISTMEELENFPKRSEGSTLMRQRELPVEVMRTVEMLKRRPGEQYRRELTIDEDTDGYWWCYFDPNGMPICIWIPGSVNGNGKI